jgi:hypothetical protein
MRNYELVTNVLSYEKEAKQISNIAKVYGVTEAIVLRSLMASSEDIVFHDAMVHYIEKEKHSDVLAIS